ncbi:MAG TPA: hypothetical protein VK447_15070 [Myxococcaceae bacterium]|nr:hypothetical protein [Myxococcaceae bacterium]
MITLIASLVLVASPPQKPPPADLKARSTIEEIPNSELPADAPVATPAPVPYRPSAAATVDGEDPEVAKKRLHPSVWIPATTGGVMVVSGVAFYLVARMHEARLVDGDLKILTDAQLRQVVRDGKMYQTIGLTLTSVGAAALTYSCVLFYAGLAPRNPKAEVSVVPLTGGAAFSFSGVF